MDLVMGKINVDNFNNFWVKIRNVYCYRFGKRKVN